MIEFGIEFGDEQIAGPDGAVAGFLVDQIVFG